MDTRDDHDRGVNNHLGKMRAYQHQNQLQPTTSVTSTLHLGHACLHYSLHTHICHIYLASHNINVELT